jgi:ribosome-binding protein aMBF1 (putative translation factor)
VIFETTITFAEFFTFQPLKLLDLKTFCNFATMKGERTISAYKNYFMSVDAMMDERYGKVGTPEREAFRKEAYAYCVGQIISDARKRKKVTQQELAQRVGTNKSYISRIENGSVEPGAGMFLRILSALGLRFEVSQPLAFG